jgi:hypothetical protein
MAPDNAAEEGLSFDIQLYADPKSKSQTRFHFEYDKSDINQTSK